MFDFLLKCRKMMTEKEDCLLSLTSFCAATKQTYKHVLTFKELWEKWM